MKKIRDYLYSLSLKEAIIILAFLLSAACITWVTYQHVKHSAVLFFEERAEEVKNAISKRFEMYLAVLKDARDFVLTLEEVTEEKWHHYVDSLHLAKDFPAVLGLGLTLNSYKTQRAAVWQTREKALKNGNLAKNSANNFNSITLAGTERTIPAFFGIDVVGDEATHQAAEQARDQGIPTLTDPVFLFGEKNNNLLSFLYLLPLYKNGVEPADTDSRRGSILGWAYVVLSIDKLVEGVIERETAHIEFKLFDHTREGVGKLIFAYADQKLANDPAYLKNEWIDVANHRWRLYVATLPSFEDIFNQNTALLVVIGSTGIILLLLGTIIALLVNRHHNRLSTKKATQEFKQAVAFRQAILDGSNYSIISTDPSGLIASFNSAAERMLGYSKEEMIGKYTPEIIHDQKEVFERAKTLSKEIGRTVEPGFEVFVTLAKEGKADEREWTYIRKDGSRFPVLLSISPLKDTEDNLIGFMGIASDITERKKIDRLKNEFITIVSHELRTPLTSITGSLGLLADMKDSFSDKVKKLIDIAYRNCERLIRLINDIVDVEKIETGHAQLEMKKMNLTTLIRETIEAHEEEALKQKVELVLVGDPSNYLIKGNPDALMSVMDKLLSNAIKYSPKEQKVEIYLYQEGGWVIVNVMDHGPGVPYEFRHRIFGKFAQADASDSCQKEGSGLGLSIAKALIEKHNGTIFFQTEPGATIFSFKLPLDISES